MGKNIIPNGRTLKKGISHESHLFFPTSSPKLLKKAKEGFFGGF